MGLRNWLREKNMKDPVQGTLIVTSSSMAPVGAMHSNCRLFGVLTAPGLPATPVDHSLTVSLKNWPEPGDELPVTVDCTDPTRLRVDWDAVPSILDVTAAQAQLANGMRTDQARPEPPGVDGAPGQPTPGAPRRGFTAEESALLIASGGGEEASAVVLAAHEVVQPGGLQSAPGGVVDITLDVTRRDGTGYTALNRVSFSTPQRRAQVATVGTRLPVRIDPGDPSRVAIDSSRLTLT